MTHRIQENIVRQSKALALLFDLLEEEFSYLKQREPHEIARIEFSIQELLKQLSEERESLRGMVFSSNSSTFQEWLETLPEEIRMDIEDHLAIIDGGEQACSRQASMNADLSLAMSKQNMALLEFLHSELVPRKETYSQKGRVQQDNSRASMVEGRL